MNTAPSNSTIRLYHIALSPYCRKVRLVLAEKRVEVELVEDRYWEPGTEIMRRNPAGKLPVLRLDGRLLAESQAICEYLDERYPNPALMPASAIDRYEVRRLCSWFDDKFANECTRPVMNERVWKKVMRLGYPDSRTVKAGLSSIRYHMDYMKSLLEQRRWLAGDVMTMADFAAAAHISCLDYISDVDWTHSSEVQEWYAKIKSRPAFRSLLADHLPGVHPAPHYALLDF
ncbi:MAG TPA: glutathione S-transferase family protein [Paracoccus sp. (in: a-proteobacteria)]|uniref:FtsZ-binding protein FzlA n=1 Tax=Paracoccus sp. TaxID=267 RepID=UPI002C2BF722|nr:glutathione S-transferase family protein [Paracoccus sp. (in: a-proteobacteria)]HWL55656.1 glutathione S-transferase family protein [Paracoccus sp. (in: a-proteobacteria)]